MPPSASGASDASRPRARIAVRIVARASRETIVGMRSGVLLVRVTAAPVDGAANVALLRVVARHLQLPIGAVRLLSGRASKLKLLEVVGIDDAEAMRRLGVLGAAAQAPADLEEDAHVGG